MSPVDARAARHGHPAPSRDGHAAAPQHGHPGTSGDGGHPSEARDGGQASACRVGGHPAPPQDEYHASPVAGHRIGLERVAELMAVAGAASMALRVLEEAAPSAREDLESVLRTVDRLTEAASRSVGAALADSGAHASEAALEQLDAWADLSRIESEGLRQYRRDRWGLANALESLNDLREAEARRLQELLERRAGMMKSLVGVVTEQADAARSITERAR